MRLILIFSFFLLASGCVNHPVHKEAERKTNEAIQKVAQLKEEHYGPVDSVVDMQYPPADLKPLVRAGEPEWFGVQADPVIDRMQFGLALRTLFEGQGVSLGFDHDVDQTRLISAYHSGTLRSWLDQLSLASGYAYQIEDNHVSWHRLTTRTFDIKIMPGQQEHLLGTKEEESQNNQNSDNQAQNVVRMDNNEFSSNKASLSAWKDLNSLITGLLSAEGTVFVSESTTSITVKDFPENVRAIAKVVDDFNQKLRAQVAIDTQIIAVELNDSFADGIDWRFVKNAAGTVLDFSNSFGDIITAATGAPSRFSVNVPESDDSSFAGSSVLIQALNEQGRTAVVTSPRAVTLNNQVAEIRINTDQAYLASSDTTLNDTATQTSLQSGVVTDGFTMYVLPKIDIDNQEIYLQFSATMADLVDLARVEAGNSAIQTPQLQKTKINNRTRLKNGETLIISGYQQTVSENDGANNFNMDILGQRRSGDRRFEILVLMTPIIMD